jgi:non-homologous end joining protein Ku
MAAAPSKSSARTTLKWGTIEVPIGLFKTTADPSKVAVFERGGPHGGRLELRAAVKSAQTPPAEPAKADPLALEARSPSIEASSEKWQPDAITTAKVSAKGGAAVPVLVEATTGDIVTAEQVRRGVFRPLGEDEGEQFVDCTDALAHIEKLTALEVMEIQGAIDIGRVPRERVTGSYYVGTDGAGTLKVLELLAQAMTENRRALVVKWTKTQRQASGVLVPHKRGGTWTIVLLQLVWPEDWREVPLRAALGSGEEEERPTPAEFERASELIKAMADSSLLLEDQRDDALALREEVHELAMQGAVERFKVPEKPVETPLLAALEESLELAKV